MKIVTICNKIIEYSFYAIFFLVPLVFSSQTSELFEFNKMWLIFGLTILVLSSWTIKMVATKRIWVQRTPLDLPIGLFLLSQILSTIFSLDPYVSFWGYYSRFNGGLLSTIAYISLFYAFLSNFSPGKRGELRHEEKTNYPSGNIFKKFLRMTQNYRFGNKVVELRTDETTSAYAMIKRLLGISLASGAIVALWGLPSHFGYDPTCFLFRGSLDVSCWTSDFQPKIRMFSTLGQPDWLGAYLAILLPLALAFTLKSKRKFFVACYLLLATLFYVDILFTKSRSALLGTWVAIAFFVGVYFLSEIKGKLQAFNKKFIINHWALILLTFVLMGSTLLVYRPQLGKSTAKVQESGTFSSGGGGTESAKIRLLVWEGALKIWTHYPLLGSGVETFAFSYYKYRPLAHNLTSEWNYLYNKAHNEYLNYLATTGIFGLLSYLAIIGIFLYTVLKWLYKTKNRTTSESDSQLLTLALISSYLSILVTNFFGFSVVIVNIYFFLIPLFALVLIDSINEKRIFSKNFGENDGLSFLQKLDILVIVVIVFYLISLLANFWFADKAYSQGSNLQRNGEYDRAYLDLQEAVRRVSFEPTFKDELASNDSILAISLLSQISKNDKTASKEAELAQSLAREAIISTSQVTAEHPNNVVFWKTKVRIFYTLSQIDPRYTKFALDAIKKAQELAPTDANVSYNLGLLYGQEGETKKAVETLNQTIKLKPNYSNAHYALGLFYRQLATNDKGKVVDEEMNQNAINEMSYILKNIDPNYQDAKDALKLWSQAQ